MKNAVDPTFVPDDVRAVCQRLASAGHQAYLVGGGVRDMLLGRPAADFDVATQALPEAVMDLFGATFAIPTGLQHGTVTVLTATKRPVEVTTFRGEGAYLDGRRPSSVQFGASLEQDLARRDFTMNAIAFDPVTGTLHDPWDGQADLRAGLVRAVREPLERFLEDGLRCMRAVRQATQLGFRIEPHTLAAIPQAMASFRKVSLERVRDELCKLLVAPRPSRGIELLRETGLLAEVLPELLEGVGCAQNRQYRWDVYRHTLAVLDEARPDLVVRLAALLHDLGKPRSQKPLPDAPGEFAFDGHETAGAPMTDAIARRLRLSNAQRETLVALVAKQGFVYTPEWTDGAVRRFVRDVGQANLEPLLELREADVAGRGLGLPRDVETRALRARIATVAAMDAVMNPGVLALDGRDVMRVLGIKPGKRVGRIVEALRERVMDDPQLNDKATLEALLPEVARNIPEA